MRLFRQWVLPACFAVACLFAAPSWAAHHEAGEASEAAEAGAMEMVDINTADAAMLEMLPGIGATKAAAIVAYRDENGPFSTVEDLGMVKGIGEATVEKLRDKITVGTPAAAEAPAE